MTATFRPGDRVRVIGATAQDGKVLFVWGEEVDVELDTQQGHRYMWYRSDLELLTPAPAQPEAPAPQPAFRPGDRVRPEPEKHGGTAWLVEKRTQGAPLYIDARGVGTFALDDAAKFGTKAEAERFISDKGLGRFPMFCRAVEHEWVPPVTPAQPEAPRLRRRRLWKASEGDYKCAHCSREFEHLSHVIYACPDMPNDCDVCEECARKGRCPWACAVCEAKDDVPPQCTCETPSARPEAPRGAAFMEFAARVGPLPTSAMASAESPPTICARPIPDTAEQCTRDAGHPGPCGRAWEHEGHRAAYDAERGKGHQAAVNAASEEDIDGMLGNIRDLAKRGYMSGPGNVLDLLAVVERYRAAGRFDAYAVKVRQLREAQAEIERLRARVARLDAVEVRLAELSEKLRTAEETLAAYIPPASPYIELTREEAEAVEMNLADCNEEHFTPEEASAVAKIRAALAKGGADGE